MNLLSLALMFLVISFVAGIFGYKGVADASSTAAKIAFFIFVVCFMLALVFGLMVLVPLLMATALSR